MIDVPVYSMDGKQSGSRQIDPDILGGQVNSKLLKQAIVMYRANMRQGTSTTKSRSMVVGSTRKLFRQKGTGNARMGTIRTNIRRGGGVAFAKRNRDFSQAMPKKMRRLARNQAILAKMTSADAMIVEGLSFDAPKTKKFAEMMSAVGAGRGCLVALGQADRNVYRSGRNIPKAEVKIFGELSAYDVLRRAKLILTPEAFDALTTNAGKTAGQAGEQK